MVYRVEVHADEAGIREAAATAKDEAAKRTGNITVHTPHTLGITINAEGGKTTSYGTNRVDASTLTARSGLLATARRNGSVPMDDVRDTDIVTYNGIEMRVRDAVAHGLLRKTADGYEETPGFPKAEGQDEKPAHQESLDEATEALLTETVKELPQATVLQVVDDFINGTEDTLRPLEAIAAQHGLNAETFKASAYHIHAAMVAQAEDAVRALGVEPEVVFEWACGFYDKAFLVETQRRHYTEGNLSGYRAMARAYLARHPKQ